MEEDAGEERVWCGGCYWAGPVNEDGWCECHWAPPEVYVLNDDTRVQTRPRVAPNDWCGQFRGRA